jgi:hypothetical protein
VRSEIVNDLIGEINDHLLKGLGVDCTKARQTALYLPESDFFNPWYLSQIKVVFSIYKLKFLFMKKS